MISKILKLLNPMRNYDQLKRDAWDSEREFFDAVHRGQIWEAYAHASIVRCLADQSVACCLKHGLPAVHVARIPDDYAEHVSALIEAGRWITGQEWAASRWSVVAKSVREGLTRAQRHKLLHSYACAVPGDETRDFCD